MADLKLVNVKYVGKKPIAFDNVAGSKKVWKGNGDVQQVTEAQAKILIRFPDQWALADQGDAAAVSKPATHTMTDDGGEQVVVSEGDLKKPLEKMTKPELVVYAKQTYGKDLDPALSKKLMLDQIEDMAKENDPAGLV